MSKIIQLSAENVKRLHAVHITPNGHLVVVGGKNGQGKTSVLDTIAMAFGGADEIPAMPVRRGEKKASIVIDLGDIIVRRTFTAQEGGGATSSLVVENKDKMRASAPQAILDKLTGKVTFDPLAFATMDPVKQAATLKRLVGLDLSGLDAQRQKLYNERTLVNRDHDREQSRASFMPEHADAPVEEVSVTDIVAERDLAVAHNSEQVELAATRDTSSKIFIDLQNSISATDSEIKNVEVTLQQLRTKRDQLAADLPVLEAAAKDANNALAAFKPVDLAPINLKLANAEKVNAAVRAKKAKAEALKGVQAIKAKADALTIQIEQIDREKDARLAATKFPVPGLSFTADGSVAFNGVPFDQASAAERMRVSVAIAAAMNPKLRVMLVRDASLLDEEGLAQLAKLAEEFDLQVWAERVGKGSECSVIIEDGSVESSVECATAAAANAQVDMFTGPASDDAAQKGAA